MTSHDDVLGVLAEIAAQPLEHWRALLDRHFPGQPVMVEQGLLWLHADRDKPDDEATAPSLGRSGDERYELTLRLASGATAAVWRAHDRKLGRNVAIKVFRVTSDGSSRELQEARAACDVISDHVVRVLDVHDGGVRPYIVMELVAEHDAGRGELALGGAASSVRPHSIEEAVRWVMDVARGVRDAHLRNVFHRDLKPQNVLITPISRRARIADFGLALSAASDLPGRSTSVLVKRGSAGPVSIAGTPEYMSPEQARGLPINLDPLRVEERSILVALDVWGLGALAYDLLTGRPPWLAIAGDDRDPWEIAATAASPPPVLRTHHGERIPAGLRRILTRAMAAEPGDRYTSAGQVAGELEAFLARRPTSFDRSHAVRAALWCRRNPQLTITGVVALGLASMTLVTYASVAKLRDQRRTLAAEVTQQQTEEEGIKARAAQVRAELDRSRTQLAARGKELAALEVSLHDEETTYAALLAAKDKALHDAGAATRELVEQLTVARSGLRTAESEQGLYRRFWDTARGDADRMARERDQAQIDRDAARAERDAAKQERDTASSERDRSRAELDQDARDLARLTAAVAAANTRLAAATGAGSAGGPAPDGSDAAGSGSAAGPPAPAN